MPLNPDILAHGIESWKLWSFLLTSFTTLVIGGYKGYQWVKGIRTEDLQDVKESLEKVTFKIEETSAAQLRSTEFQTQSLVRELSELRGLLYGTLAPKQMAPARKRTPRKKTTTVKLLLDND